MTVSQIESMLAKRLETKTPWEARQSRLSFADIDEETLKTYIERGREKSRIPFAFSDEAYGTSRNRPESARSGQMGDRKRRLPK